jgi:hypothetical protein
MWYPTLTRKRKRVRRVRSLEVNRNMMNRPNRTKGVMPD